MAAANADAGLLELAGHAAWLEAIVFSPDGHRLATAGDDRIAILWDAASGRELHRLSDHSGAVSDVAFSPDGSHVATASADKTAKERRVGKECRSRGSPYHYK